jgi:pimeloyl-ACP methyl ester carboxylesterase
MSDLAFSRVGAGQPLVLLHGIGMSRRAWEPVIPALAAQFDVIAVDLAGFGESPPLPDGAGDPASLARAVGGLLDDLGVATPRLAGNSLGGWVALELAAQRPVAAVTLLSPAGLWQDNSPRYCRISLRVSRWLARHLARPLSTLVRFRLGRVAVLGQTHAKAWLLSPDDARRAIRDMGSCPGFEANFAASTRSRYAPDMPVTCPVTVAFGSRDVLLRRRHSRHVERLPEATRAASLPGCGHVPMADDPQAVAALIAEPITEPIASAQRTPSHTSR